MSSGEAAHPAVTSMGTWCELGKQKSTVLVSYSSVEVVVELLVLRPFSGQ